jgi:hypothetical protein
MTAKTETPKTWLVQAFAENPDQVFSLDPFDESLLRIDPARNSRGSTPEIGDKSLTALIEDIETIGQTTACFAALDEAGVADLYAGFRRARAVQTLRQRQVENGTDAPTNPYMLRVVITPGILTPQEIFERSLSENVFREGMTIMQKISALRQLTSGEPGFGLTLTAAAKKMNMNKGSASIYLRADLFPAIAKKAMNTFDANGEPKLGANAIRNLVNLLPSSKDMEAEPDEMAGTLLSKAQEKIARLVQKMLDKSGKVSGAESDAVTRKVKDSKGEQANKRARPTKLIVSEIDEELGKLKETAAAEGAAKAEKEAAEQLAMLLAAVKKFANGGSMKALVKALTGEARHPEGDQLGNRSAPTEGEFGKEKGTYAGDSVGDDKAPSSQQ